MLRRLLLFKRGSWPNLPTYMLQASLNGNFTQGFLLLTISLVKWTESLANAANMLLGFEIRPSPSYRSPIPLHYKWKLRSQVEPGKLQTQTDQLLISQLDVSRYRPKSLRGVRSFNLFPDGEIIKFKFAGKVYFCDQVFLSSAACCCRFNYWRRFFLYCYSNKHFGKARR